MSTKASTFSSVANSSVSKRPIWLVEAACLSMALPPTIQRMAIASQTVGVVEAKVANADLDAKQVESYRQIARTHNIDCVITILAALNIDDTWEMRVNCRQ